MKNRTLVLIGLSALAVLNAHANQEQLFKSIKDTHVETSRGSQQLATTLNALNALTAQKKGDLRPAYNGFVAEVDKTKAAAEETRKRVQWMGSDGRQYFRDWQKTVDSISNASLKKKAQKRLDSVNESYGKVETSLQEAANKFRPFLSDLDDIQKALASDVTPAGVKAIRGTVRDATWNHQFVNNAINSALKEMGKMEKALASEAK